MMGVTVSVDRSQLVARLRKGQRRLRFAVVNALNGTAREIQKNVRGQVKKRFTVRSEAFIMRETAKIRFAAVRQSPLPFVEVYVGQKPRLFLSKFEEGEERTPYIGRHVALPVIGSEARPSFASKVPKRLTFESFGFVKSTTRSGSSAYVSRDRRFYLVAGVGVFMRAAKGSHLVYSFRHPFRLDPRLHFIGTAVGTTRRTFPHLMDLEVKNAISRSAL